MVKGEVEGKGDMMEGISFRAFGVWILSLLIGLSLVFTLDAESGWPQYMATPERSNLAEGSMQPPFQIHWVYQPPGVPCPAWEEPGREVSRLDFDYAHQPVIFQGKVFFCSTRDDSVRALDLATGQLIWRVTTGAPMRFAPAVEEGKVYAVSDDGCLYCLDADNGKTLWTFRAAPRNEWLLGNGRMISRWPMRSGLVLKDGVIYTAAGMWPTEGIYLYALNASSGEILWRNDSSGTQYVELPHPGACGFSGVAPQGYMALADDILLVPTGRGCPAAFQKDTGRFLYCWPHRNWNHARRGGCWLTTEGGVYFNSTREARGTSPAYVGEADPFPKDGIVAYDILSNQPLFELQGKDRLVVAGQCLYAVGFGEVAGYDWKRIREGTSAEEAKLWSSPIHRAYSLVLAGDLLLVGGKGILSALNASTGERVWYCIQDLPGSIHGLAVSQGRIIASTEQGVLVCFGEQGKSARYVTDVPNWRSKGAVDSVTWAEDVTARVGEGPGYAFVLGQEEPSRLAALALKSQFHVIQGVFSGRQAEEFRESLFHTGLLGHKIGIVNLENQEISDLPRYFADVMVLGKDALGVDGRLLYERIKPCGGKLIFGQDVSAQEIKNKIKTFPVLPSDVLAGKGRSLELIRGPLPGSGEWRRQWADSGKSGIGEESRLHMPLQLLWFGGPGPDRMMDRHYRTSAPLSVEGRVFITGEHHLIAFDAYNGKELWETPIRGIGRRGAMWSSANMVADDTTLYAAVGSACARVDQKSGRLLSGFAIPDLVDSDPGEWEYIEVVGKGLLGSCKGSDGRWRVFSLHKDFGVLQWVWIAEHRVPSASLAASDTDLFFMDVEAPDEQAKRRGDLRKPKRRLICLNLENGQTRWENTEVPSTPLDAVQVARGVVCIYANVAYDEKSGEELWKRSIRPARPPLILGDWILAEPFAYDIRDGSSQYAREDLTGETRPWRFLRSYGCGGIVGCQNMLFFRSGVSGFYDFEADGTTTFGGVRAGCSINMIPANGLVILPESSSGCTCSYNFQTSLALAPIQGEVDCPWFVTHGSSSHKMAETIRCNLGAAGDKRLEDGAFWMSVPRPILRGAVPAPLRWDEEPSWYEHQDGLDLEGLDMPWLYGSGLQTPQTVTIDLVSLRPVVARSEEGQGKVLIPFDQEFQRQAWFHSWYDDEALSMAFTVSRKNEEGPEWIGETRGSDARVWEDDSWEVWLSDAKGILAVHLGVSVSGARFDGLWDYSAYDPYRGLDRAWNGTWESHIHVAEKEWTLQIGVPWNMLDEVGLDRDMLKLSVLGTGPGDLGSPDYLSVHADGFHVVWNGYIQAPEDGDTTFILETDEMALMKVDGETWIKHEGRGKVGRSSGVLFMEAGKRRRVEISYAEEKGPATIRLLWEKPGMAPHVVPSDSFFTPEGIPGGLLASYRNRWYEDPVLTRVDPTIDFHWAEVDPRKQPKASLPSHWGERSRRCETWLPLVLGEREVEERYRVRLHITTREKTLPSGCPVSLSVGDTKRDLVLVSDKAFQPRVELFEGICPGQDAMIHVALSVPDGHQNSGSILLCGIELERQ